MSKKKPGPADFKALDDALDALSLHVETFAGAGDNAGASARGPIIDAVTKALQRLIEAGGNVSEKELAEIMALAAAVFAATSPLGVALAAFRLVRAVMAAIQSPND